jgi:hypothetical protein
MIRYLKDPRFLIGVAISVVFLVLTFRRANLGELGQALSDVDYIWLLPVVALNILTIAIRAYRWRLFFPDHRLTFGSSFSATMIGFMANNVLPARIGEVARALVLGRRERLSASTALATIVAERLLDMISILLVFGMFIVGSTLLPREQRIPIRPELRMASEISLGLALVALVVMVLLRLQRARCLRLLDGVLKGVHRLLGGSRAEPWSLHERLVRPFGASGRERIARLIDSFIKGLEILGSGWTIAWALVLSFLLWGSLILAIDLSFVAFLPAFGRRLPLISAVFLIVVMAIGVSVPSGPGFVGTFHWITKELGLKLFGIVGNPANAYVLVVHACSVIPVMILGTFFLFREGLTFGQLQSQSEAVEGEDEEAEQVELIEGA